MENNEFQYLDKPVSPVEHVVEKPAESIKSDLRTNILTTLHDLVFVLAGLLLALLLVFRVVIVSGPSMNATLIDGDYILLLGNVFYSNQKQGDIIVASKQSFKDGEPIIKRIIATEGQTVDIDLLRPICGRVFPFLWSWRRAASLLWEITGTCLRIAVAWRSG